MSSFNFAHLWLCFQATSLWNDTTDGWYTYAIFFLQCLPLNSYPGPKVITPYLLQRGYSVWHHKNYKKQRNKKYISSLKLHAVYRQCKLYILYTRIDYLQTYMCGYMKHATIRWSFALIEFLCALKEFNFICKNAKGVGKVKFCVLNEFCRFQGCTSWGFTIIFIYKNPVFLYVLFKKIRTT